MNKSTNNLQRLARLFLVISAVFAAKSGFAQGSLTPPGVPAPTMKSLDQIEARTPISSAPFNITNSGSYFLTASVNVTVGSAITISTNRVTLDLNGFTISSTASGASGMGILLGNANGNSDITILNGCISSGITNNVNGVFGGNGFANGIIYLGSSPQNIRVAGISIAGCLLQGISLGQDNSTLVESCTVRTVGGTGIQAGNVSRSSAYSAGAYGIVADTVSDSSGYSMGSGSGIGGSTANNCFGGAVSGAGVGANTANNCYGVSVSGPGISALNAANCRGFSSTSQGVNATTASNCYGESTFNRGVSAEMAMSCYGYCGGGSFGVKANSVANSCYGFSATGTGVAASITIGCVGLNNAGTSVNATYHYNMPPSPQTP